nr:excisionase [Escherichia coli]
MRTSSTLSRALLNQPTDISSGTSITKDGREYLFHESAVKVDLNRPVTGSLLKRIRNGKKAKS